MTLLDLRESKKIALLSSLYLSKFNVSIISLNCPFLTLNVQMLPFESFVVSLTGVLVLGLVCYDWLTNIVCIYASTAGVSKPWHFSSASFKADKKVSKKYFHLDYYGTN